jgi:hypothetical protein
MGMLVLVDFNSRNKAKATPTGAERYGVLSMNENYQTPKI